MLQLTTQHKLTLHHSATESICISSGLHLGAARHAFPAHINGDADHSFIADNGDFTGRTIFQAVDQRNNPTNRKMQVFDMIAGFGNRPA